GGYTLTTAGIIPRTWRDGVEVDYENWNAYETVQGEEIVHQEWGSGLLRMAAGGEAVEIEVDPVTAEVVYYSAPLASNLPTVSIEGIDTEGAESPVDTMLFRITRAGSTTLPLNVDVSFSGDAVPADYTTSPDLSSGVATIPAGESSLDILISPVNDGVEEPAETINLNILSSASYRRSSPPSASGTIAGFPVVSLSGSANASEAGSNGFFTLTRTGDTGAALTVDFSLGGTATPDTDYTVIGATTYSPGTGDGTLTIQSGQASATLTIDPIDDPDLEGDESVLFDLVDSVGYVPGATSSASIIIVDNEVPPEPTYLAEKFDAERGAFDLQNKRLTFEWNGFGYTGFIEDITSFETDIASTGTQLNLDNDDNEKVTLSGGQTVSFHGSDYGSFYVSSNGCITFDSGESGNYNAISYHFTRIRISVLFVNLRVENGGQIRWQQLADRTIVQYQDVLDYSTGSPNTCQVEMFHDGTVRMSWLTVNSPYPLVGLSNGSYDSETFEQTDFSAWPGPPLAPMEEWQLAHFTQAEIDAGLAAPEMDVETIPDGIPNILEYAFGMDPRVGDAHLAQFLTSLAEDGETLYLDVTFRRNPEATDVSFSLETSRTAGTISWSTESPAWEGAAGTDFDGMPLHTYRVEVNSSTVLCRVRIE
ncbi:MAG: hypothetical protein ACP5I4_09445, partial [Oceanipulchritudo sp.]